MKINNWNIVTTKGNIIKIKRASKFFKQDLGKSLTTIDIDSGGRKIREKEFTEWYYNNIGVLIYKEGKIGILNFYSDYYLKKNILGLFKGEHNFMFEFDENKIRETDMDTWLGSIIKESDEEISKIEGNSEDKSDEDKNDKANAERVIIDPGSATWEDIKKHYNKKKGVE